MILVYKTNVNSKRKVKQLQPILNKLLPTSEWNFDLEDCDKILRVVSKINVSKILKAEMAKLGIEVEPLPD